MTAGDDAGIRFGERLVALLDGGRFTATYKHAATRCDSAPRTSAASRVARGDRLDRGGLTVGFQSRGGVEHLLLLVGQVNRIPPRTGHSNPATTTNK